MHKKVNEPEVGETKKIDRCKSSPSVQSSVYFEEKPGEQEVGAVESSMKRTEDNKNAKVTGIESAVFFYNSHDASRNQEACGYNNQNERLTILKDRTLSDEKAKSRNKKKKRSKKVLHDKADEVIDALGVESKAEAECGKAADDVEKDSESYSEKKIFAEEFLNRPKEMSHVGNVTKNWDIFKEDLEYYMDALPYFQTGPQNDKEACDLMLMLIGKEGRKIYESFIWKKNEGKTMEAVIGKFDEAFQSDKQISKEGACNNI